MSSDIYTRTWLIIPLFNEASVISDVVTEARKIFPNIVCVDDGSRDDSALRAREAGAWLVPHPFNLGQGASLQTGIEFALRQPNADFFITFDADGQHLPQDAERMLLRLDRQDLDIVIGSRFIGEATNITPIKRVVLKFAVSFERLRTGLRLTDAHNGLRAFTRQAAERIQITQNRMAHASELTSQIAELKLKYAEEPVTIRYTDYSKSKGQSVWNSVNILSELWMR